jgi:hypothetical protein
MLLPGLPTGMVYEGWWAISTEISSEIPAEVLESFARAPWHDCIYTSVASTRPMLGSSVHARVAVLLAVCVF